MVVGILWPAVLAAPIVLLAGWIGIALVVRAIEVYVRPFGGKPRSSQQPHEHHFEIRDRQHEQELADHDHHERR